MTSSTLGLVKLVWKPSPNTVTTQLGLRPNANHYSGVKSLIHSMAISVVKHIWSKYFYVFLIQILNISTHNSQSESKKCCALVIGMNYSFIQHHWNERIIRTLSPPNFVKIDTFLGNVLISTVAFSSGQLVHLKLFNPAPPRNYDPHPWVPSTGLLSINSLHIHRHKHSCHKGLLTYDVSSSDFSLPSSSPQPNYLRSRAARLLRGGKLSSQ